MFNFVILLNCSNFHIILGSLVCGIVVVSLHTCLKLATSVSAFTGHGYCLLIFTGYRLSSFVKLNEEVAQSHSVILSVN